MADADGYIDMDEIAEFHPTTEVVYEKGKHPQQKWVNELGEHQWRDVPLNK